MIDTDRLIVQIGRSVFKWTNTDVEKFFILSEIQAHVDINIDGVKFLETVTAPALLEQTFRIDSRLLLRRIVEWAEMELETYQQAVRRIEDEPAGMERTQQQYCPSDQDEEPANNQYAGNSPYVEPILELTFEQALEKETAEAKIQQFQRHQRDSKVTISLDKAPMKSQSIIDNGPHSSYSSLEAAASGGNLKRGKHTPKNNVKKKPSSSKRLVCPPPRLDYGNAPLLSPQRSLKQLHEPILVQQNSPPKLPNTQHVSQLGKFVKSELFLVPPPSVILKINGYTHTICTLTKIGRNNINHIFMNDPTISREHAQITKGQNDRWTIRDCKSFCGTHLEISSKIVDIGVTFGVCSYIFTVRGYRVQKGNSLFDLKLADESNQGKPIQKVFSNRRMVTIGTRNADIKIQEGAGNSRIDPTIEYSARFRVGRDGQLRIERGAHRLFEKLQADRLYPIPKEWTAIKFADMAGQIKHNEGI